MSKKSDDYQIINHSRKPWRLIAGVFAFLILFQLFHVTGKPPATTRIAHIKSSYDWSTYQPFNPRQSPHHLPTGRPKRLSRIQHGPKYSAKFDVAVQERRRSQIRRTAQKCWDSYKKSAWMYDELTPLTAQGKDTFGGWAATIVDAMDTLWIMGLEKEFREAVKAVVSIDWAKVQGTSCNMFETTIRHLGGLLSAYDLSREPALLAKAVELGDMLYAGFDTPNHMPPFWFDFEQAKLGQLTPDDHQPAASATSLSLEFTRLAQLTGSDKYYDAVARVTDKLYETQNKTALPGLWPTFFNLKAGIFNDDVSFTLGALSDSMYEYILKMYILLGATEPKYEELYLKAADAIIENLIFRPMTPDNLDILFTGTYRAGRNTPLDTEGQHLACFAGGMFAMGGQLFTIPEHIEIGARLTKGCIWAYNSFPTGIAPEIFKLVSCETTSGCEWNETMWKQAVMNDNGRIHDMPKGFRNARDPRYLLRPEALESVFILYRITGEEMYREAAWTMFQAIEKATETMYGNSAIVDVTVTGAPQQSDSMEVSSMCFWVEWMLMILLEFLDGGDIKVSVPYILTKRHD